jgi:hypothetical protein
LQRPVDSSHDGIAAANLFQIADEPVAVKPGVGTKANPGAGDLFGSFGQATSHKENGSGADSGTAGP